MYETNIPATPDNPSIAPTPFKPKDIEPDPEISMNQIACRVGIHTRKIIDGYRASLCHAKRAGDLLNLAKKRVKHGQWRIWIWTHIPITVRTAQVYMRIAKNWETVKAKAQGNTLLDLSISSVVKLLGKNPRYDPKLPFLEQMDKDMEEVKRKILEEPTFVLPDEPMPSLESLEKPWTPAEGLLPPEEPAPMDELMLKDQNPNDETWMIEDSLIAPTLDNQARNTEIELLAARQLRYAPPKEKHEVFVLSNTTKGSIAVEAWEYLLQTPGYYWAGPRTKYSTENKSCFDDLMIALNERRVRLKNRLKLIQEELSKPIVEYTRLLLDGTSIVSSAKFQQ